MSASAAVLDRLPLPSVESETYAGSIHVELNNQGLLYKHPIHNNAGRNMMILGIMEKAYGIEVLPEHYNLAYCYGALVGAVDYYLDNNSQTIGVWRNSYKLFTEFMQTVGSNKSYDTEQHPYMAEWLKSYSDELRSVITQLIIPGTTEFINISPKVKYYFGLTYLTDLAHKFATLDNSRTLRRLTGISMCHALVSMLKISDEDIIQKEKVQNFINDIETGIALTSAWDDWRDYEADREIIDKLTIEQEFEKLDLLFETLEYLSTTLFESNLNLINLIKNSGLKNILKVLLHLKSN